MRCSGEVSHIEIVLLILTGAFHVIVEMASKTTGIFGGTILGFVGIDIIYNGVAVVAWCVYLAWRVKSTPGILREWGFRRSNFTSTMKRCVALGVPATACLLIYAGAVGYLPFPRSFWIVLFAYPAWGIAQQFAIQVLIARNLRKLVTSPIPRAILVATLFSASHIPNFRLVGLTFPLGVAATLIYNRHPNIWAIGLLHGVLGTIAYYAVLGEDPLIGAGSFFLWLSAGG